MSTPGRKLRSIEEMRRRFDESFAAPPPVRTAAPHPLLAITVAGEPMAVRLLDIASLATGQRVVLPVPSSVPELMGITGIRGTVVPVFDLAALLGCSGHPGEARWLLLCDKLALAFQQFERYLQVDAADIHPADHAEDGARRYVTESVRHDGRLRAIVNVAKIVAHLTAGGDGRK